MPETSGWLTRGRPTTFRRTVRAVLAAAVTLLFLTPTAVLAQGMDQYLDREREGASLLEEAAGAQEGPVVDTPFLPPGVSIPATWYPYLSPPPEETLHPDLRRSPAQELSVIVQFHKTPSTTDLEFLRARDIGVEMEFTVLPALHVVGPREAVLSLGDLWTVRYVEPCEVAVQDMEVSTSVINASKVWSTKVVADRRVQGPITGGGLTCCVVDTGIDAGHPDLDYGEKTLFNRHYDGVNWVETENSDLSIGHGTHVAGTVAGNGDASAGARRGVAPDGRLIGLSAGNVETEANYLKCLEWVYQNSRPSFDPYDIRLATNSWHTSVGEYDPDSALTQVIEKLAFENNVLTTWSAGNDGRDDPEGTYITTSQQGTTPVAIMCAAYEHDGSAAAEFTSRGQVGLNHTYPDVGAPGVRIWSCSARRTVISSGTYTGGNRNPYYLAISGTSMSTPHVAGLVLLVRDAAPSLGISAMHEDYGGDDPEGWYSNPLTLVHEVELILEATATHLPDTPENGVPVEDDSTGWGGREIDYVQGYGIVNADEAVALALTLEELRRQNPDRYVSVHHALRTYQDSLVRRDATAETDRLTYGWSGEYSRYNDQFGRQLSAVNQTKTIHIPDNATEVEVDLLYAPVDLIDWKAGDLSFTIDYGADGSEDYSASLSPELDGARHVIIPVSSSNAGMPWAFDITGLGVRLPRPLEERNYVELRMEYDMTVEVALDTSAGGGEEGGGRSVYVGHEDYRAGSGMYDFVESSPTYAGGNVTMKGSYFDMDNIEFIPREKPSAAEEEGRSSLFWSVVALVILGLLALAYIQRDRLMEMLGFKKEGGKKKVKRTPKKEEVQEVDEVEEDEEDGGE